MKLLIIGGTGTVGSHVVKRLLKENVTLRVLTTSPERAGKLPEGVEGYIGDLEDPASLTGAFQGMDQVFMVNQHTENEITQGLNAVSAAKDAGIRKFVYQSIHNVRAADEIDHFHSKIVIEDAILDSGMNYVFISPNNFYQNDIWYKESITKAGLYNQPIGGVGLSRIDVRDIADAVAAVMLSDRFDRKNIVLAGPDIWTGTNTAKLLSDALNLPVAYAGDDLDRFKTEFYQWFPHWIIDDWAVMYGFFQKNGLLASPEDLALLREVLGHEPISYAQYIDEFKGDFLS